MFYRGVSEEVTTTTTTNASSNIENSIHLNSINTDNMNNDDKHLALSEFNNNSIQSIGKDLIKQEPSEKHLYKFEYSNSQANILLSAAALNGSTGSGSIGGSTTSSSSATNSASSSPSASSSNSTNTNRKYSYQEHTQPQSAKRKQSDHHHSHHHHHKNNNSHASVSSSSSSQQQVYHQKPVYSEFVSSKCILFIYYKGDLSFVIDDHFKKSMTLNAAKSSASLSPLSLSSASTSPSSKSSSKSSLHKTSKLFSNSKLNWKKIQLNIKVLSAMLFNKIITLLCFFSVQKIYHYLVTKLDSLLLLLY